MVSCDEQSEFYRVCYDYNLCIDVGVLMGASESYMRNQCRGNVMLSYDLTLEEFESALEESTISCVGSLEL